MAGKGRGTVAGASQDWDGNKWVEVVQENIGSLYHDTTHNPVALYQLNESLTDTSGNGLTSFSVVAGTERYTSILPGLKGALFDGSTVLYVNAAESSLQITGDLTVEMIVSASEIATAVAQLIVHIASGDTEPTNCLYNIQFRANTSNSLTWFQEYGAGVNQQYDSNIGFPYGRPVHLAVVRSSNHITFYLNGERFETGSTLTAPTGGASGRLYLGGSVSGADPITGAISSLKIINSALTPAQIRAEYNRTLGKVFGEHSLFSYRSAVFNGTDEYITMGNVLGSIFEYNLAFSISAWFKTTNTGSRHVVTKTDGTNGWALTVAVGQIRFTMGSSGGGGTSSGVITTATFNDGSWHHIIATYSAATPGAAADMSIYVDGVAAATSVYADTLGTNSIANTASFNIAGRTDGSAVFPGSIDEVAVHSKELSAAEVEWIYNGGRPQDLRGPGAPSNLVGWWPLGEDVSGTTAPDRSVNSNNGTLTNMTAYDNVLNDYPR